MRSLVLVSLLVASHAAAEPFPTEPNAAHAELERLTKAVDAPIPSLTTRPYTADEYRKLFLAMWAQVPNWKSGDPLWARRSEPPLPARVPGQPRPKRPPPHEPDKLDWFDALLGVDLAELEQPFTLQEMPKIDVPAVDPAHRDGLRQDALFVVATMRALAASHRAEAVQPLFELAFVKDGVFRDECGRQIRAIGDAAVAPLVRLQYTKGVPSAPLAKQRRYAVYQLDRMDRARPNKAIQYSPDDKLRAELIHVYGEMKAPDAVEAILEQTDAASHRVRREARWAFRRYVEGPPPPPAPVRKRRLPGGGTENDEKPDYLTYREVAMLALQKQVADMGLPITQPHPTELQLFEAIIAKDDADHAAEWERVYETAKGQANAGDLDGAIGNYEWVLAHDPTSSRRAEMAPVFARAADAKKRAGKLDEAAGLYWKAAALAPPDEARRLEAEASLVDADRAQKDGRTDESALRRASELDPTNASARERLDHIQTVRSVARHSAQLAAVAIAAAICLAVSALAFALRRRS